METISGERVRRGWRSLWAAIGAAVAVSLGAGGFFIAEAASGPESSIVMADPVRILDTRDLVNVGLPGPFISPIAQKLQVTGPVPTTSGTQTVVPPGATGVLLNVTAVGATADGFISIRPGDATGPPATSSLNVTAGVTVPNAVPVALPTTGANAGEIDITWDALGVAGPTTDILIDVVGHTLAAEGGGTTVIEFSDPGDTGIPKDEVRAVGFVRIAAPADGKIVVSASASVEAIQIPSPGPTEVGGDTSCSITTGNTIVKDQQIFFQTSHILPLAITRGFPAVAGESYDFSLLCETNLSDVKVENLHMTAIFASTP
jgi:hypothetical protein